MEPEIPERVHIVPFGVERDRILEPVVEYHADRVGIDVPPCAGLSWC